MKASLIILGFFSLGVMFGTQQWIPAFLQHHDPSMYALYLLIFVVGVSIGGDPRLMEILRAINFRYFLVPVTVILGTFAGVGIYLLCFPSEKVLESFAVGSGFGYYSLSSILISQLSGKVYGIIALLSNITRELFTLLLAPMLARYFGKLAPIVCGGATAMDTTLPIIVQSSGKEYAFIAIFSGIVLTILVPVIIGVLYQFLG
jgi:uncharacterized membrane protein YbjE (DUF340 family)